MEDKSARQAVDLEDLENEIASHRQWLRWAVWKNVEYARYFRAVSEKFTGAWNALDARGARALGRELGVFFIEYFDGVAGREKIMRHQSVTSPVGGGLVFTAEFGWRGAHAARVPVPVSGKIFGKEEAAFRLVEVKGVEVVSYGLVHFVFLKDMDEEVDKAGLRAFLEGPLMTVGGALASVPGGLVIVPPEMLAPPVPRLEVENTLRVAQDMVDAVADWFRGAFRGSGLGPGPDEDERGVPALPPSVQVIEWARGADVDEAVAFLNRLRSIESLVVEVVADESKNKK